VSAEVEEDVRELGVGGGGYDLFEFVVGCFFFSFPFSFRFVQSDMMVWFALGWFILMLLLL